MRRWGLCSSAPPHALTHGGEEGDEAPVFILAIDLGTSGPKVALVGVDGSIAASAVGTVDTLLLPPDGAEQDPEAIWTAVLAAIADVLRAAALPAARIRAITCSSHYFSVVPVDAALRPTMNCILWMDRRGAPYTRQLYATQPDAFAVWVDRHGMVPLPSGNDSLSHLFYVREARPDVYARTAAFLEPADFLVARLTGTCSATLCSAFPLLLTDNRDLTGCAWDAELLRRAGIERDKLPALLPVGAPAGRLRPALAEQLGLSADTVVFTAMNDTQAAAIGTATFRGGGALNIGTTSQVLAHIGGKASDLEHALLSMPSPIAGRHMVMAENGLGAKTLDHFLQSVVFARDALADHRSATPFAGLEHTVHSVPPGCDGLLYLPWLTGAPAPDSSPRTRGGFLNVTLATTRAHMVRAILEGVACNMRWVLPAVETFAQAQFDTLAFSGGAAVSDAWAQILADVIGRPVAQLEDARFVNNRGSAFLGFVALEALGLDDIDRMCRVRRHYDPDPAWRARYDDLFAQFLAAFEATRPIFDALNE